MPNRNGNAVLNRTPDTHVQTRKTPTSYRSQAVATSAAINWFLTQPFYIGSKNTSKCVHSNSTYRTLAFVAHTLSNVSYMEVVAKEQFFEFITKGPLKECALIILRHFFFSVFFDRPTGASAEFSKWNSISKITLCQGAPDGANK